MSELQGDNAAALDFLRKMYPDGPWVLTAIRVDRKAIDTQTFRPATEGALLAWLKEHNGNRNIYFGTNPPMRDLTKKAEREDIKEVAYLHVDIDPRAGEDQEQELVRIITKLEANTTLPKPTVTLFSGGGVQCFWKLETPIPINGDLALAEAAKLYNLKIEQLLGGDNTHDVSRIMRVPGTINIPDAKKLKKGRVPKLAKVLNFDLSRVYSISKFQTATVAEPQPLAGPLAPKVIASAVRTSDPEELNEWNVPDRVKVIMVQGKHPDEPKPRDDSRSAWLFDFVCSMVRSHVPNERTLGILLDSEYAISASVIDKGRGAQRYAERQIRKAHEFVALDALEFESDKNGKLYQSQHNIRAAMHKLGVTVRHNVFADRLLIDGLPGFDQLNDPSLTRLRLKIDEQFKLLVPKEFFYDVVMNTARDTAFHPVCDYLDGLVWDKQPRIDTWLATYGGSADTPYTRAVGALVLMAAVRRVRKPGCKFDEMLVLECTQGTDKSTALETLAVNPDWFTDDMPLNAETAKVIERLKGKWIVEAAELKGMKAGGTEHLKAFLSRKVDIARPAYGRVALETPRQSVFIGTTNNDNYLRDETGNRRFWPVKIETFDLAALRRDRDQLWAEAAFREAEGASIRLDPGLYAAAASEQEARRVDDPWVAVLQGALGEREGKLRAAEAWVIVDVPVDRRTQDHNVRLGASLKALGWERKLARYGNGKTEQGYVKGDRPKRVMCERSSNGHLHVFYEGEHADAPPF